MGTVVSLSPLAISTNGINEFKQFKEVLLAVVIVIENVTKFYCVFFYDVIYKFVSLDKEIERFTQ